MMQEMGFFRSTNFGPVWLQANDPKAQDFVHLLELSFWHALCHDGLPLRDTAKEAYAAGFTAFLAPDDREGSGARREFRKVGSSRVSGVWLFALRTTHVGWHGRRPSTPDLRPVLSEGCSSPCATDRPDRLARRS